MKSTLERGIMPARPWSVLLAVAVIAATALAAYHNTFSVPLLLDDQFTIQANPSIRHLWPLGTVLSPPKEAFSAGRPFLNLTYALNYAMGGVSVRGYHVFNLLIHILSGIALFGIVRVTLSQPRLKESYGGAAILLALAVAVLWTLHPAHTESVTYITQRTESMMGLFYLSTLYFFIRAALSPSPGLWASLSLATCLLGMMTKEVMVSAPLVILLYDRTFIAGTFRNAWRQRRGIYLGLAATWLPLAYVMTSGHLQDRGVGYDAEFTAWTYALTESHAVVGYLKLALWPHPLVFDYGLVMVSRFTRAAPYLLILALLLSLTALACRRWPSLGFLGAWFFLILAPTSSIVPLTGQPVADHRLYLPSAAIVALEVMGVYALAGRKGLLIAFPALAILFGILTVRRNSDYRDEVTIWRDTVAKRPGNYRAHDSLGNALAKSAGRFPEAIAEFEAALKLNPAEPKAHNNMGIVFEKIPGRLPDAIAQFEAALKVDPNEVRARSNLGIALAKLPGRLPDAIAQFEAALKVVPDDPEANYNLALALSKTPGRMADAVLHYEATLKIDPDNADAHNNLGNALADIPGRLPDAIAQYEAVLKIDPNYSDAHYNLGVILTDLPGRLPEAIAHFEAVLRINPEDADAHRGLMTARLRFAEP